MKTLTTIIVAIASAAVGIAATSAIYENWPVKSLRTELSATQFVAAKAAERAGDRADIILSCNEAMIAYGQLAIDYKNNYDTARAATNAFFDRYSLNAGDANYLYFVLYATDRAMDAAFNTAQPAMADATKCSQGLGQ